MNNFSDRLIDMLHRRGKENFDKFLEIIGIYYPQVYKQVVGKEADIQKFSIKVSGINYG